jgi:hypothetical protein
LQRRGNAFTALRRRWWKFCISNPIKKTPLRIRDSFEDEEERDKSKLIANELLRCFATLEGGWVAE